MSLDCLWFYICNRIFRIFCPVVTPNDLSAQIDLCYHIQGYHNDNHEKNHNHCISFQIWPLLTWFSFLVTSINFQGQIWIYYDTKGLMFSMYPENDDISSNIETLSAFFRFHEINVVTCYDLKLWIWSKLFLLIYSLVH